MELIEDVERAVRDAIKLAEDMWRSFKLYIARECLKLTETVESWLREYVEKQQ